jgi:hypothetical protein
MKNSKEIKEPKAVKKSKETKAPKAEVSSSVKTDRVEIYEQNGKPYKKVTWINGVANIERL